MKNLLLFVSLSIICTGAALGQAANRIVYVQSAPQNLAVPPTLIYTDTLDQQKIFVARFSDIKFQPVGSVQFFAGSTVPASYIFCDGAAISRTTYADLFAVLGTTYGVGDGSTTFNIPDLRQRFPLGKAVSGTGSTLGGTGGAIDHLHAVDPPNTTSGAPSGTVAATILAGGAASTTHTHDVNIASFNSGTANPPFLTLNAIIKY